MYGQHVEYNHTKMCQMVGPALVFIHLFIYSFIIYLYIHILGWSGLSSYGPTLPSFIFQRSLGSLPCTVKEILIESICYFMGDKSNIICYLGLIFRPAEHFGTLTLCTTLHLCNLNMPLCPYFLPHTCI